MHTGGAVVDLASSSHALTRNEEGIWVLKTEATRAISFPQGGHEACFRLEDESFWFQHRNACIVHALERVTFDGPLLDVGGGNGAVSQSLEAHGFSTIVVEPGPEGAKNARTRGLPNVVCATLEDAAFEAESFGAAGVFDVIEHVENDVAVLGSIHRVLRPGGALCVTVPAFSWLWSDADEVAGHFRRYTLAQVRKALTASGFSVRYETYFFAPLTAPVFVMRSLRSRGTKRSEDTVHASAARDHASSGIAARFARLALEPELAMIRTGRKIPFGTSCLVVAEKR